MSFRVDSRHTLKTLFISALLTRAGLVAGPRVKAGALAMRRSSRRRHERPIVSVLATVRRLTERRGALDVVERPRDAAAEARARWRGSAPRPGLPRAAAKLLAATTFVVIG